MSGPRTPGERAVRLLRWYPQAWRERYGGEFAELLIADIEERPRSAVRMVDVARAGLTARLARVGLTESPVPGGSQADEVRAGLGTLCGALALCLVLCVAMWSQLAVAWRRAPNAFNPLAALGGVLTTAASAAMLAFLALAVLAVLPVGFAVARRFTRPLAGPALVLASAVTVLALGGHHFIYQWPGTGGVGGRGALLPFIPSGLLAFLWSLTYWFSSFWGHWSSLSALSPQDLAWMAASPVALAAAVAAAVVLVRRAELSPRLLAYETRLATVSCTVAGAALTGCGCWVFAGRPPGPAQGDLAHAGLLDIAATALLALAFVAACQARQTALRGLRRGVGR